MEPEVQKFAAVALIGLLAFFPVFNQVKDSSLEALRDADHQARWSSFFKDWDDIPEDEKLEYWDGRNRPPGGGGDFDRDRIDDDARIEPPRPTEGDRDGDGVPDDQDADPDDPDNNETRRYRLQEVELWRFTGADVDVSRTDPVPNQGQIDFEWVNLTYAYEGYTGAYRFEFRADSATAATIDDDSPNDLLVQEDGQGSQRADAVGTAMMEMVIDYDPLAGAPQSFVVRLLGYHRVYDDEGDT